MPERTHLDLEAFQSLLRREYARFQDRFGPQLLGVVEIGSFARGEAVSFSDHDLRLVIHCTNPLYVLDEHQWTEGIAQATVPLDWQDLNQGQDLTFGLTNLAFVERGLQVGRYPLIDHTCLYQGRILMDDSGSIASFHARYHGVRFSNIVPDYMRQTEWRVTTRLPRELDALTAQIDRSKYAVPSIHTCYRIVRDLANIASYRARGVYVDSADDLVRHCHECWPWFEPTFQTLRRFKTNEGLRRAVFDDVVRHDRERIQQIRLCARATVDLWERFRE